MRFESVIGLEVHAQLRTRSKIFCGCSTTFGAPPNTHICPVCLGHPGALPVLNRQAVDFAIKAALALGCAVQETSVFARKNYFYPDLPKGYQISQYDRPLALGGGIDITVDGVPKRVRLTRIHMEEDAGKSLHEGFPDADRRTAIDFNRSGTPLIEIVSEPDMRSAAEAAEFFMRLRDTLVWLGVNDGNMEEGSLRCDANVSVRPVGQERLGTKAEVKNVNSFRYLQKAIEFEIDRQIDLVSSGGTVVQETRLFDSTSGRTHSMRSKEEAHDYRYFPEPDLPPVIVDEARKVAQHPRDEEVPEKIRQQMVAQFGLPDYDAGVLTQSPAVNAYFQDTNHHVHAGQHPKVVSNWVMGEVLRIVKERGDDIDTMPVRPRGLAGLITLVTDGAISTSAGKTVLEAMLAMGSRVDTADTAAQIVAERGLAQVGDESALLEIIRDVMARNADAVAQYRAGKQQTFGFLVGQVMKGSRGKANPTVANELLKRELGG